MVAEGNLLAHPPVAALPLPTYEYHHNFDICAEC